MATAAPDAADGVVHRATSPIVDTIDIALLGLGQVGAAVARAALDPASPLSTRLRIAGALVRDTRKVRNVRLPSASLVTTDGPALLAGTPDVVVELLGGIEPAFTLVSAALTRGIPVVTANKSLLAARGDLLDAIAAHTGTPLLYEASVLAGVPFLGSLGRRPIASAVTRIEGIVNGTTNFILSEAAATGARLDAVLAVAQARGFAEPDPRNDVDGIDAAEKLAVLVHHFGWGRVRPEALEVTGIGALDPADFAAARELGGVLKPVVFAERTAHAAVAFVGPAFVPASHRLSRVDGVENAIALRNGYGDLFFCGPGAGPVPTAATVLDDIAEVTRPGYTATPQRPSASIAIGSPVTGWLVRLTSTTRLPSPSELADLLGSHGIWLQRTTSVDTRSGLSSLHLLTWDATREHLERALTAVTHASGCTARALRALEAGR